MSQPFDADDIGHNDSPNPHLLTVLDARLSRRGVVLGGLGAASAALLGGLPTSAAAASAGSVPYPVSTLKFTPVAKNLLDRVTVPEGYSVQVLYALGDPLHPDVPAYANDGTDIDFHRRAGDHHDGMEYFGLSSDGRSRDDSNSTRALLAMNHEAITDQFLHINGTTPNPRPKRESDKEMLAHGISIVEIQRKASGRFATVQSSAYNRRITPLTPATFSGPVAGSFWVRTLHSPTGTTCRGTINNCGTGKTPWGTLLSGEENWAGYFTRASTDDAARTAKSVVALNRYGRSAGSPSRHGWETSGTEDKYRRFDISRTGTSNDGSDDYRHEINTFGYLVEVDPYDPKCVPVKHTAMGRFAHESAAFGLPVSGQPLVVYMGDDARNEYIYKFVSHAAWNPADATPADPLSVGRKYLGRGTLYVARFNADGSGDWIALTIDNSAIANYSGYKFANQADVLIHARLAADAVGATKMDRPEWSAVHPITGEAYFTLTNNSNRKVTPSSSSHSTVDAANPRSYSDSYAGGGAGSPGNVNGHILRLRELNQRANATQFEWDIYVFGAEAGANKQLINLSSLTAERDFSSPDGLWFSQATGIGWIQTDDGAYTDVSNCMMLAALPGQVGDGDTRTLDHGSLSVQTPVGAPPTRAQMRRFLVGVRDCEITGCCETPDGRALFVNIQHPGESISSDTIGTPQAWSSHWPGRMGYGNGGSMARPRSATVVVTKDNGGLIGS